MLVFALDVVSAIVDLLIFIVSPKIEDRRKRLREARQADIEATSQKRRKESLARQQNIVQNNYKTTQMPKGLLEVPDRAAKSHVLSQPALAKYATGREKNDFKSQLEE